MSEYSPLIFKNPDKRTDFPDVTKENFGKEMPEFNKDVIEYLKGIINVQK